VATSTERITKRTVDSARPRDKPFIIFDAAVKGFGVRVMPTGARSFVLEYRPGAGGRSVAKRRRTLGRYGAMTVDQARTAALNALAHVRLGSDPQAEKSGERASPTVAVLIGLFTAEHVDAKLKAGTTQGYKIALEKLRAAHGGIKASQLTRAQVAALHARMRGNPYGAKADWPGVCRRGLARKTCFRTLAPSGRARTSLPRSSAPLSLARLSWS
jgi:hypothetical protein